MNTRQGREAPTHPAINLAAQPRHGRRIGHAVADHQRRRVILRPRKKLRDIFRSVLTITVHRESPGKVPLVSVLPAGAQRGSFSAIGPQTDDFRARRGRFPASAIGRTVVHHEHMGQMRADAGNERANKWRFIVARNDGCALRCPIHERSKLVFANPAANDILAREGLLPIANSMSLVYYNVDYTGKLILNGLLG